MAGKDGLGDDVGCVSITNHKQGFEFLPGDFWLERLINRDDYLDLRPE